MGAKLVGGMAHARVTDWDHRILDKPWKNSYPSQAETTNKYTLYPAGL